MLRHWLADPASRLITLIGPGGVGKTRLALGCGARGGRQASIDSLLTEINRVL